MSSNRQSAIGNRHSPEASPILVEAAVENLDQAVRAEQEGADRLELCAELSQGGLTPSRELLDRVRRHVDLPVFAMVRPRAGDFHYSAAEFGVLLQELAEVKRAGADGIVSGMLTANGSVDQVQLREWLAASSPLSCTFHRAVDATPDFLAALRCLAELGVTRVLTSGGAASAEVGVDMLAAAQRALGDRIRVIAGGGVRAQNVFRIVRITRVPEVHVGLPANAEAGRISDVRSALGGHIPS